MSSEGFPINQESKDSGIAGAQRGPVADRGGPMVGGVAAPAGGGAAAGSLTQNGNPFSGGSDADRGGADTSRASVETGPLRQGGPLWQGRTSGAPAADASSGSFATASYPSGSAVAHGTGNGQNRPRQYGLYSHPRFTGDGSPAAALGYTAAPGAVLPVSAGAVTDSIQPPHRGRRTALVVAAVVVLAFGAGIGGGLVGSEMTGSSLTTASSLNRQSTSPVVSVTQPVVAGSIESVAAKLLPSVVSILSISPSQQAEGSGVILSADGLILTNNHVVAGATDLTVKFNNGTTATAKVVGSDATDDLAVIKVSGVSGLTVATLGSSANVKVGEQVVAVGSPLGLSATVTSGIVSALNRPVRTMAEQTPTQQGPTPQGQTQRPSSTPAQGTVLNAIQTDAAINPGNSGGALVDMNGAVIGINSAIASLSSSSSSSQSGSIGVGFAIPIDEAHRIAQEIISSGHATHAVLGASVGNAPDSTSANAQAAAQAGLSVGAKIATITSGGAAAAAGLQANDVITKIGSTIIGSADALIATIRSSTPGGQVVVAYLRGSTTTTTTVTLGSAVSS